MTTIAWDGDFVASDSQCTQEDFIDQTPFKKIHNVSGEIVCLAGDVSQQLCFLDWYQRGADKDLFPGGMDSMAALVITPGKELAKIFENGPFFSCVRAPYAIGTGSAIAMGAMFAGATAKHAIKIAKKLDKDTGGKTVCVDT